MTPDRRKMASQIMFPPVTGTMEWEMGISRRNIEMQGSCEVYTAMGGIIDTSCARLNLVTF